MIRAFYSDVVTPDLSPVDQALGLRVSRPVCLSGVSNESLSHVGLYFRSVYTLQYRVYDNL